MTYSRFLMGLLGALVALGLFACQRDALTGSKLTLDNFNKVTTGMSKVQVEAVLGAPT